MKTLLSLISVVAIMAMTGCTTTQQRTTYTTLATVEATTTATVDGYYLATIKGLASTNGIPQVSQAFNKFQAAFVLAVDIAQNNTNALASSALQQEAADVVKIVGQFYKPSATKLTP